MPTRYWDAATKWWTGSKWIPQAADYPAFRFTKESPTTAATTLSLVANPSTVDAGASTTLTATVSPSAATGSVVFSGPGFTSGAVPVSGGVATYVGSPSGTGNVTATFTGTGIYLGSSAVVSVTVRARNYYTKRSSDYGLSRSGYQWGQSSGPHTMQSTFNVGGAGDIPNGAVITGIRIEAARYYSNPTGSSITGGIYNSAGTALSTVGATANTAGGTDTPATGFDIPDLTVNSGTYRIGFTFPTSAAIQWDYDSSAPGFTYYADGAGTASKSLLWEIDYYVWA